MDNWLKRCKKVIACNETVKSYNFIVKKLKTATAKRMFQEKAKAQTKTLAHGQNQWSIPCEICSKNEKQFSCLSETAVSCLIHLYFITSLYQAFTLRIVTSKSLILI